jgi:methylenetetrahydrofolate dehydrogenase (NADP+)/methenyltetrahydrofolate cyclohydrolase
VTKQTADHRHLLGAPIRDRILDEVRTYVDAAGQMGKIVSIAIDGTAEVEVYIRNQARIAAKVGLDFDQQIWPRDITQDACKSRIQQMNDDPSVLGIIIQRPLPSHINIRSLQSAVHPLKDIEGMNPASIGNIVYSDIALVPCTAAASVEMIKATGLTLAGLEVVMIGHSEIVGRPAAMMLMAEGATVTICHHLTRSVAMHSRRADVVLVAVGSPHFIGPDMIKPGAAVIDIGINQITNNDGTSRIVGDVDTAAVTEVAGWITPVPGGVGPVTVAVLMRNAVIAHQRQRQSGWL